MSENLAKLACIKCMLYYSRFEDMKPDCENCEHYNPVYVEYLKEDNNEEE